MIHSINTRTMQYKPALSRIGLVLLLMGGISTARAQQVIDIEKAGDIKKNKAIQWSGGISANTILYSGNGETGREAFNYYLNGTLTARLWGLLDVPVSFNLTNVGHSFNYPTLPSRIGIHPKYKSVTAHLGNVSMSFSPYTLNGYQFLGAGVDVEPPKNHWKVSAMAGRLQKASQYDSANTIIPAAYQRFGYGVKVVYAQKLYRLGVTVFGAKDKVSSLIFKPDSIGITPKQNLVVSWNGSIMAAKDLELSAEYASSALTRDLRDTASNSNGGKRLLTSVIGQKNSTALYKALKANLNYKYKNSVIGVGYERVDPGYETLGAYYFNNDLENVTVNVSQPFAKGKGQIAGNVGFQKDNLDDKKFGSNKRAVYALNVSLVPNARWVTTFSYSNFTTYMYIRPLYQWINQTITPYTNLDTLNYSQVTQNTNLNVNYMFPSGTDKSQSLNFNMNYLRSADKQGGVTQFGAPSTLLMVTLGYTLALVPSQTSLTVSFNTAYNDIANTKYIFMGPTVVLNKKLGKNLSSNLVSSYNKTTGASTMESTVFNNRLNLTWTVKTKHNFSFGIIDQARTSGTSGKTNDFMVLAGYGLYF